MNKKIIEKICDKNNLKILKTIHENPGKDSVVIHVKDSENIEKIIKICGDTASQKVKESFQNECEFYLKCSQNFIPLLTNIDPTALFGNTQFNIPNHSRIRIIKNYA